MNYYVEINKNTHTHCVHQLKEFNNFEEASNYFKNVLLEFEPEDKGCIELGEDKIIYQFICPNKMKSVKIEKDVLEKSNSFIQDYLISKSDYFYLKILKIRITKTRIKF